MRKIRYPDVTIDAVKICQQTALPDITLINPEASPLNVSLEIRKKLAQQLTLSPQMIQSIQILALGIADLHELVAAEVERNPVLEFLPVWEPRADGLTLLENLTRAAAPGLRDDLRFQLHVSSLSGLDAQIGEYIINCVDERGYLTETVPDIASQLQTTPDNVNKVLNVIRGFEPIGVAAFDIKDCLVRQLQAMKNPDPIARDLIENYLDDLGHERYQKISRESGYTGKQIQASLKIIKSLRLYPGESYGSEDVRWVLPEVQFAVEDHQVSVSLYNELPTVKLNEAYTDLSIVSDSDDETAAEYIREAVARANWLVQALGQRRSTLLAVSSAIAVHQRTHFLAGTPPVPLNLETIASDLGIAISTVSRAISERYYLFNRKIYPFRDLFPSRLQHGESDALIKAEIQRLIAAEDRRSPLSDQKITDILEKRGVSIARRTVAKYRTELGIDTASKRRDPG